jgi:hypothetical protein
MTSPFFTDDGGAAQIPGAGQDDVLELLDRRCGDRRVDPGAIGVDLARGGDPNRIGAKILVEDADGQLDPLTRRLRLRIPVGDDDSAVGVGLKKRREGDGVDSGLP